MSSVLSSSRRFRRGFTIIELLVAIGVTAILVTLMLTITINVLGAWNRSSGKLSANATARLVLDQLAQDLSAAVMRRDGNVWLAATVQVNQTTANGNSGMDSAHWTYGTHTKPFANKGSLKLSGADVRGIEDCRFGQAGVWLRLFVATPSDSISGIPTPSKNEIYAATSAPRAVSWQLIRRQVGGTVANSQYVYQLFRSEVRPFAENVSGTASVDEGDDNVFAVGYDLYMPSTDPISYNKGEASLSGNVGNIRRPHVDQLIGVNVVDFGLKLYGRNASNTLVELFPGTSATVPISFAATSLPTTAIPPTIAVASDPATGGAIPSVGFPTEAELFVRILTPEGVRLLTAFEEGVVTRPAGFGIDYGGPASVDDDDYWWDIVIKNSDVYTRRVDIKSVAL